MITKFGYGEYVGKAHVSLGLPCQDKALCVCRNGVYVAVVSDGCGSAKNSQMGSAKTVEIVAEQFTERFDEFWTTEENALRKILLTEICNGLRAMINENEELFGKNVKGRELCSAMDSLDATALFVAVKGEKVIAGMVGDGIVGAIDEGALRILMEEPKFEGLENATWYPWTVFYLSEAEKNFEINKHFLLRKYYGERFGGFILMSDGVSALVGRKENLKFLTGGTEKVFELVKNGDNGEETARRIKEDCLRVLANASHTADDCSLAVLADSNYCVTGTVYKQEETLEKNPLEERNENGNQGKSPAADEVKASAEDGEKAPAADAEKPEEEKGKTPEESEGSKSEENGDKAPAQTEESEAKVGGKEECDGGESASVAEEEEGEAVTEDGEKTEKDELPAVFGLPDEEAETNTGTEKDDKDTKEKPCVSVKKKKAKK